MSTSVSRSKALKLGRRVAEIGGDLRILPVRVAQRRRDACDDLRVALGPLARVVDRRRDRESSDWREQQLAPDAQVVEVVHVVLRAGVVEHAVTLGAGEGQPAGELLAAEGPRDRGLRLNESQVAVVELEVGGRREAGPSRRDVDGAGRRVLAEERALRSAQHFDPLDVEEVERRRGGTGVEDAVDVEADARLDAVVGEPERRTEAPDLDRRVARIGRVELHRRNQFLQPVHVERADALDQGAVDHRDRNRHFLRRPPRRAARSRPRLRRGAPGVRLTIDRGGLT